MASTADEIIKLIISRPSYKGGPFHLSDTVKKLGLDSMEVVSLTFDIEEKFDIELPFNANVDIENKTVGDIIEMVEALIAGRK